MCNCTLTSCYKAQKWAWSSGLLIICVKNIRQVNPARPIRIKTLFDLQQLCSNGAISPSRGAESLWTMLYSSPRAYGPERRC